MRNAVLAQAFGAMSWLTFSGNILLLYMAAMGVDSARIVFYLALPGLADALVRVPAAWLADRWGIHRVAYVGFSLELLGLLLALLAGFVSGGRAELLVVASGIVYWTGNSTYVAGWLSLLSPLVPENQRGRFFGKLRTTWQLLGVGLALGSGLLLTEDSSLGRFQAILAGVMGCALMRVLIYRRIPELEPPQGRTSVSLMVVLRRIRDMPGFVSFCCYNFLLATFTVGCPALFALIEKRVLDYGDRRIAWLGGAGMIGSLLGFYLGGKAVDRWSTRPVFMCCHFGYAATIALFLLRGLGDTPVLPIVVAVHGLFGFMAAAASIAITSEIMALIPAEHKSTTSSICLGLARVGAMLSGSLASWTLNSGMLAPQWQLLNLPRSHYDAVLALFAMLVVLLVVTLSLVPSVLGKAQWIPRATTG